MLEQQPKHGQKIPVGKGLSDPSTIRGIMSQGNGFKKESNAPNFRQINRLPVEVTITEWGRPWVILEKA
jgi:hypothetical protein